MKPHSNEKYRAMRCRVYLVRETNNQEEIPLCSADQIHELVRDELVTSDREIMLSVLLTIKNHLIGVETVAIGSLNVTCLVPREVFKGAILANAASIILCHNHPSGDLTPSKEDIHLTEEMMKAGKLLGIRVLDHIIVSNQGYVTIHDYHNFTI